MILVSGLSGHEITKDDECCGKAVNEDDDGCESNKVKKKYLNDNKLSRFYPDEVKCL